MREALWRIRLGFTSLGTSPESEDGGWERRREVVNFFLSITMGEKGIVMLDFISLHDKY